MLADEHHDGRHLGADIEEWVFAAWTPDAAMNSSRPASEMLPPGARNSQVGGACESMPTMG